MSTKALMVIDGFCIALFLFIILFIFVLPDGQQGAFVPVMSIAYRGGPWIMGIGLLFTCLWGKGKHGILSGIILLICYLITSFFTLFGLIVLTAEWELLWYVHPVLVIPGCIIALWKRRKKASLNKT